MGVIGMVFSVASFLPSFLPSFLFFVNADVGEVGDGTLDAQKYRTLAAERAKMWAKHLKPLGETRRETGNGKRVWSQSFAASCGEMMVIVG